VSEDVSKCTGVSSKCYVQQSKLLGHLRINMWLRKSFGEAIQILKHNC